MRRKVPRTRSPASLLDSNDPDEVVVADSMLLYLLDILSVPDNALSL